MPSVRSLVFILVVTLAGGCSSETGDPGKDGGGDARIGDARIGDGRAGDAGRRTPLPSKWIHVKAGTFTMGSSAREGCRDADEGQRQVTLTRDVWFPAHEVTQKHYRALTGASPAFRQGCDTCPVEWVSWHEAVAYCNALSAAEGKKSCYSCSGKRDALSCTVDASLASIYDCTGYRLPTEAEWEYAARAGSKTAFHNGEIQSCMTTDKTVDAIGWYKVNSGGSPHPVGQKKPNAWGLYDMSGNVYEWTHDGYQADPGAAAATDPVGPEASLDRVFRGGAWYFNAEHARSANRDHFVPSKRFTFVGFRCVRTAGK